MPQASIEKFSQNLLTSYKQDGGINHVDKCPLPSKKAIEKINKSLLKLLFPGFWDDTPVTSGNLSEITKKHLAFLVPKMQEEIEKNIACFKVRNSAVITKSAQEITTIFLNAIPEIRTQLKQDADAAYEGDPAAKSIDEIILAYPFLEAIAIYRLAHFLYNEEVELIARMMSEWAHSRTGIDIHPGAKIGTHFFIDHGTGVVIGETCVIGNHVKLYHGVTLGAKSFEKDADGKLVKGTKRHPNIEDNVIIYPNASILGGKTTIGRNSTIGANVSLSKSVPKNTLVLTAKQTQKHVEKKDAP